MKAVDASHVGGVVVSISMANQIAFHLPVDKDSLEWQLTFSL